MSKLGQLLSTMESPNQPTCPHLHITGWPSGSCPGASNQEGTDSTTRFRHLIEALCSEFDSLRQQLDRACPQYRQGKPDECQKPSNHAADQENDETGVLCISNLSAEGRFSTPDGRAESVDVAAPEPEPGDGGVARRPSQIANAIRDANGPIRQSSANAIRRLHAANDANDASERNGKSRLGAIGMGNFSLIKQVLADSTELDAEDYDVSKFYHSHGLWPQVAVNDRFGHATLLLILLNGIYLGWEADYNTAATLNDAEVHFQVCEIVFCVLFTVEVFIRFAAFEVKRNCLRDSWFKFDSALLFTMWVDTWIVPLIVVASSAEGPSLQTGALRLLRLLRVIRLMRILEALPELVIMVRGFALALRVVGSAAILLSIAIYAWAIALKALLADDDRMAMYWGTVPASMMTLFGNALLADGIVDVMRGMAHNVPAFILLCTFTVGSTLTVLNMVVGVMVEVVKGVSEAEKEASTVAKLKHTLLVMLKSIDEDGNGRLSKDEINSIIERPEALTVLYDLKISLPEVLTLVDVHFHDHVEMTIPQVMQLLLSQHGEQPATVETCCTQFFMNRWLIQNDLSVLHDELASLHALTLSRFPSMTL